MNIVVVLAIVFILVAPIFSIVALNTLFGLHISINIGTWLATAWLMFVLDETISKVTK